MGMSKKTYMFRTKVEKLARAKGIKTPNELHKASGLALNTCKKFWHNNPPIQMIHGEATATLMAFFCIEHWPELFEDKLYMYEQHTTEFDPRLAVTNVSRKVSEDSPEYTTGKDKPV